MFFLIMQVYILLISPSVSTRLCAGHPLGYALVNSIEETTYCLFLIYIIASVSFLGYTSSKETSDIFRFEYEYLPFPKSTDKALISVQMCSVDCILLVLSSRACARVKKGLSYGTDPLPDGQCALELGCTVRRRRVFEVRLCSAAVP